MSWRVFSFLTALSLVVGPTRALAEAPSQREEELAREIAELRKRLEEAPSDLDARFALAQRLVWRGEVDDGEREALKVVAAAPEYWDAQLLLARVAAWSERFPQARARIGEVLSAQPRSVEALQLAADIELWAGRPSEARAAAAALLAVDDSADSRFRAARAAALAMSSLESRRLARRVLELDPDHSGAKMILRSVERVRFTAVSELEFFPDADRDVAFGQLITATLFPSSRWSASLGYDYRLRFGTENHRGSVAIARRFGPSWQANAFVRAGATEVVPELSVAVGAQARLRTHYGVSVRYLGDKMPWPGQLHRFAVTGGVGLPAGIEVGASYEAGLLRYCAATDPVQSASVRADVSRRRFVAGLRYGFGMELDRAPLPPFLAERFGDDVCAADPDSGVDLSLRDTRAQIVGGEIGYEDLGRLSVRLGYTLHYRLTGGLVHVSFLSVNVSI